MTERVWKGERITLIFFLVSLLASTAGAICGIGGGVIGRMLNKKMDNRLVEWLFIALMAVIIAISLFNSVRYAGG